MNTVENISTKEFYFQCLLSIHILSYQLPILANQSVPGPKEPECAGGAVPILNKSHFC